MDRVSIGAVSSTPVPLPVAATKSEIVANDAAFQLTLLRNHLQARQVPAAEPINAFATTPVNTAIDPPWSASSDNITFQNYIVDTGIGVSSAPAPTPFGATLPALALGFLAPSAPAQPSPFAQHGIGINVSSVQ